MNPFDRDNDKKGFNMKQIQSPIQVYQLAKQEQNIKSIFQPPQSVQSQNQIKKTIQPQLKPLNLGQKDENKEIKRKDNSGSISERNLEREQIKDELVKNENYNEYQLCQNNIHQQNQTPAQNPENLHFNQNGQKKYFKNQNFKLSVNSEQSPNNILFNKKIQSQNSKDMISPKSIFSNPTPKQMINTNEQNNKISLQQNEQQSDINLKKNEECQQLIQNNLSPKIQIKKQIIDCDKQQIQQNIKLKSSENQNSVNSKTNSESVNEIEKNKVPIKKVSIKLNNHQKSDIDKVENLVQLENLNQENEFQQVNKQNIQTKGVEKMLQKITSEQKIPSFSKMPPQQKVLSDQKIPSKIDLSQRAVKNQNFRINIPKTIGSRSNEDNQIVSGTNGSNNSQSKETNDTPQSQNDDKSPESLTDIYNNDQYKNEHQITDNQINVSLQDIEQVKIDSLQSFQMIESNKSTKTTISEIEKRRQESSLTLLSEPESAKNSNNAVQQNEQKVIENNDYLDAQIGELLGQGAYGKVFKGFIKSRGKFIAIKEIKEEQIQMENANSIIESIYKEIQLLKQLSHKNIVNYIGSKKSDGCVYIYMEYMSGGSISEMLKRFGGFDEEVIQKFVKQLLQGLTYLHSKGVLHRDLKGANILSDGCGNVKLADFGAARSIEDILQHSLTQSEYCNSIQGSLYWMAPELIKNEKHGRRIDVWSLGCTVIEMASGSHPWQNIKKYSELANAVFEQQPIPIPQHLSPECIDFIQQCCTYDKKLRPKSNQLLSHPFLQKTYK